LAYLNGTIDKAQFKANLDNIIKKAFETITAVDNAPATVNTTTITATAPGAVQLTVSPAAPVATTPASDSKKDN
jgi:hypothetical protein